METVDLALAQWAVSQEGLACIQSASTALREGEDELALGTRLRSQVERAQAAFAVQAAATRLRAVRLGVEGAERLVLTREALEQSSHPLVAAWRATHVAASRAPGTVLVDLCAGTGGDAVALAAHGPVTAVERDPGRAVLARHRASVAGVDVTVLVGDALDPPLDTAGAIVHADPDRRDASGRRARRLAEHRPAVDALLAAHRDAAGALVTVAPGLDWSDPSLPADADVTFLQVDERLVEATIGTGAMAAAGVRARAVLLTDGGVHVRTRSDRGEQLPVGEVGSVLLTPAPAVVRARLHDEVGAEAGAWRLATRRALLCADRAPDSPWLRAEPVLEVLPGRPKALRTWLRDRPQRRVELLLHGVSVDPAQFLRGAGRPATGPDDLRVHLVRRDRDTVAIVCGDG